MRLFTETIDNTVQNISNEFLKTYIHILQILNDH